MNLHRRTLTLADAAVVAAGLLLVGLLQLRGAEPEERTLYVVEKRVETLGPAPKRQFEKAFNTYETFLTKRGYYGAFASAEDGGFGWADNHTSQSRADRLALDTCSEYSEACQIIARLRPEVEVQFDGIMLSYTQAVALDRFPTQSNHKAIALSNYGVWGAAWERSAPFVAKQAALRECQVNLENQKLETQDDMACRLVTLD